MTDQLHAITDFAVETAQQAGELIIRERRAGNLEHDYKDATELVTQADYKADEFITERIKAAYPQHRILSEEAMPDLSQAENVPFQDLSVSVFGNNLFYIMRHTKNISPRSSFGSRRTGIEMYAQPELRNYGMKVRFSF